VLHWYSDTLTALRRATQQGCFFSVNPAMVRSKHGQEIIAATPRERVLTETDGPYVKVDGRPAEPGDVRLVLEFLAKEWGTSLEAATAQVFENYKSMVQGLR